MLHLSIWNFLVLFLAPKTNFEIKFGGDGLLVDYQQLFKEIIKIVSFMLYGSPQNEILFTCIFSM